MKTKVLFFVLASAFLAMLVMGCEGTVGPSGDTGATGPQGPGGGGGAGLASTEVTSATELSAALDNATVGTITVTKGFPTGVTTINKEVIVNSGVTLTVNGNMTVDTTGVITNNGTIVVNGTVSNVSSADGIVTNNGTMEMTAVAASSAMNLSGVDAKLRIGSIWHVGGTDENTNYSMAADTELSIKFGSTATNLSYTVLSGTLTAKRNVDLTTDTKMAVGTGATLDFSSVNIDMAADSLVGNVGDDPTKAAQVKIGDSAGAGTDGIASDIPATYFWGGAAKWVTVATDENFNALIAGEANVRIDTPISAPATFTELHTNQSIQIVSGGALTLAESVVGLGTKGKIYVAGGTLNVNKALTDYAAGGIGGVYNSESLSVVDFGVDIVVPDEDGFKTNTSAANIGGKYTWYNNTVWALNVDSTQLGHALGVTYANDKIVILVADGGTIGLNTIPVFAEVIVPRTKTLAVTGAITFASTAIALVIDGELAIDSAGSVVTSNGGITGVGTISGAGKITGTGNITIGAVNMTGTDGIVLTTTGTITVTEGNLKAVKLETAGNVTVNKGNLDVTTVKVTGADLTVTLGKLDALTSVITATSGAITVGGDLTSPIVTAIGAITVGGNLTVEGTAPKGILSGANVTVERTLTADVSVITTSNSAIVVHGDLVSPIVTVAGSGTLTVWGDINPAGSTTADVSSATGAISVWGDINANTVKSTSGAISANNIKANVIETKGAGAISVRNNLIAGATTFTVGHADMTGAISVSHDVVGATATLETKGRVKVDGEFTSGATVTVSTGDGALEIADEKLLGTDGSFTLAATTVVKATMGEKNQIVEYEVNTAALTVAKVYTLPSGTTIKVTTGSLAVGSTHALTVGAGATVDMAADTALTLTTTTGKFIGVGTGRLILGDATVPSATVNGLTATSAAGTYTFTGTADAGTWAIPV